MSTLQPMAESLIITTAARLHLGFFDLNGALGRKFGSLGIAISQPSTQIIAKKSNAIVVTGCEATRAEKILHKLFVALGASSAQGININITQVIPSHAGLGSGTQLALAIGKAYSQLYQLNLSVNEIAQLMMRGARSGIGVGTFLHGGVVVDGGRGANTLTPPIIARVDFPENWRIILIMDASHQGVHGEQEINAFNQLSPAPSQAAEILCRQVLMQALPALAEQDLCVFGQAVRELQIATGDYFAPEQGGRFASQKVAGVIAFLEQIGVVCLGQSSWGPTGFAIVENEFVAMDIIVKLKAQFAHEEALSFSVAQAQNHGALIE